MHVSDRFRFVFIHNPKTAGMSIGQALTKADKENKYSDVELMHLPIEKVHQRFPEVIEKMKEYYTFMVVRNPWTRCISSFSFHSPSVYKRYCESGDLKEYQNRFEALLMPVTKSMLLDYYYHPFIRQVDMAYLNGTTYVNDFFKFEEIPNCFDNTQLFHILKDIGHINQLPMRHTPHEIYTENLRRKVIELYSDDFDTFGYHK